MEVIDLIKKSPIRVFEESMEGGLGRGNLGVLTSPHGVGKTACMVHLAIDKILQGKNIVHVSFGANVEHIMNWYKTVFKQIADYRSVDDAVDAYSRIRENRVMMNFSQENVSMDKIVRSLQTLVEAGSFKADAVFFDGYKMTVATEEDVKKIKKFAEDMNVEVWCSVSPVRPDVKYNEYGIAESFGPYLELIDVLVGLHYNDEKSRVIMTMVQEHKKVLPHPAGVCLDPQTMLICD